MLSSAWMLSSSPTTPPNTTSACLRNAGQRSQKRARSRRVDALERRQREARVVHAARTPLARPDGEVVASLAMRSMASASAHRATHAAAADAPRTGSERRPPQLTPRCAPSTPSSVPRRAACWAARPCPAPPSWWWPPCPAPPSRARPASASCRSAPPAACPRSRRSLRTGERRPPASARGAPGTARRRRGSPLPAFVGRLSTTPSRKGVSSSMRMWWGVSSGFSSPAKRRSGWRGISGLRRYLPRGRRVSTGALHTGARARRRTEASPGTAARAPGRHTGPTPPSAPGRCRPCA